MTSHEIEEAVKRLQTYDWSAEFLHVLRPDEALDPVVVAQAQTAYEEKRGGEAMEAAAFLEAIGATDDGVLTKGGLIFLGRANVIRSTLGDFEYRFSRTAGGDLPTNEIWADCIWLSIAKAKEHFGNCNRNADLDYQGHRYSVPILDEQAFHEAFLNAVVHRDYSHDGMVSVEFTGRRMYIRSPGTFYAGVTADNIAFHQPRHRNKALAKMLMQYHLVDRAGMGVKRMGINSLRYGRAFPDFKEVSGDVEVAMDAEFLRPGIFVLTAAEPKRYNVAALMILNTVYETGYVSVAEMEKRLQRVVQDPWDSMVQAVALIQQVEWCGSKSGVYIRVLPKWAKMFAVGKVHRVTQTSAKHVNVYRYLRRHGEASTSDLNGVLQYAHNPQASKFLREASYVARRGNGPNSRWFLRSGSMGPSRATSGDSDRH